MTFSPAERSDPQDADPQDAAGADAAGADAASAALNRLITHGYCFLHPRDSDGEITAVVGVRAHGTVVDVVRIEGEDEVVASRIPGDEPDVLNPHQPCWQRTGPLSEVVDNVLELADGAYAPGAAATRDRFTGCWVRATPGRSKFLVAS